MEAIGFTQEYVFLSKTSEELSLVCETEHAPENPLRAEHGWKGVVVEGTLDFGLVGILARLSGLLAGAGISLFAVSTYNTDYIFVKAAQYDEALRVLLAGGYEVE